MNKIILLILKIENHILILIKLNIIIEYKEYNRIYDIKEKRNEKKRNIKRKYVEKLAKIEEYCKI